jgi:hypothetical protein
MLIKEACFLPLAPVQWRGDVLKGAYNIERSERFKLRENIRLHFSCFFVLLKEKETPCLDTKGYYLNSAERH